MIKDVLKDNLDVVFCGTARGTTSAAKGYFYAHGSNRFYGILHNAGFTPHMLRPEECFEINQYRIGLTDLVHTESGNDNEISVESYDINGFIEKMSQYAPKYIAFNGKKAASYALRYNGRTSKVQIGLQEKMIGQSKVFVLPSTSGSASKYWEDAPWFALNNKIKIK